MIQDFPASPARTRTIRRQPTPLRESHGQSPSWKRSPQSGAQEAPDAEPDPTPQEISRPGVRNPPGVDLSGARCGIRPCPVAPWAAGVFVAREARLANRRADEGTTLADEVSERMIEDTRPHL